MLNISLTSLGKCGIMLEMGIDKTLRQELAREQISNLLYEINKQAVVANLPELTKLMEKTSELEILIDPE